MAQNKNTEMNPNIVAVCAAITAILLFASMALWFAVQNDSVIAIVVLVALLFGGALLTVQVVTVRSNAMDNAQLIAALMANREQAPSDPLQAFKVAQNIAKAEENIHRANRAAAQAVNTAPLPQGTPTYEIRDEPMLDTSSAIVDID